VIRVALPKGPTVGHRGVVVVVVIGTTVVEDDVKVTGEPGSAGVLNMSVSSITIKGMYGACI
jgi:hypothetical protein